MVVHGGPVARVWWILHSLLGARPACIAEAYTITGSIGVYNSTKHLLPVKLPLEENFGVTHEI